MHDAHRKAAVQHELAPQAHRTDRESLTYVHSP